MLKKSKKINKILAMILLMLTLFSIAQPIFAVSSSGTGKWVPGQYDSGIKTTDSKSNVGILIRRLINATTGERLTVFCAEHFIDSITGNVETAQHIKPTDPKMKEACKVAYFGWYVKHQNYIVDGGILAENMKWVKLDYVFTQQLIWEKLGQSSARFLDPSLQNQYEAFRNDINNKIANMKKKPSFSDTVITVEVGENIITDTNGVLADYTSIDKTINGIRFVHNKGNNTMSITVSEDCKIEDYKITDQMMKEWGMIKEETKDNDTTVFFQFREGVQNQLYAMHYNDPVTMSMQLKINLLGRLELSKLNTNGDLVEGAIFNVTGANGFNKDVEVTNGKIILEKIRKGTYLVKEKFSPEGYLLNTETYKVEVKPNQTATQAIVNDEPTGEIEITKIDIETGNKNRVDGTSYHGDASIKGAEYTLYASEDIYNKKGTIKYFSKDEEIAKFTFNEKGVASVKITNNTTPAQISVKGSKLIGLPMGNFYSKETVVPKGYTKDTNTYTYTLSYKDSNTKVIKTSGIVKNTVQKAPFEVIKISTNNNTTAEIVENAEFTAILTKYVDFYGSFDEAKKHLNEFAKDEYSIFRTGADGHGISGLLAYGEYTVNETYTPSPDIETVEQFYVTIDKDSKTPIKEIVANDLPFEAYIKLQKQDKKTGKFVTYSNATFELYRQNENTKKWEQVECKVGDKYHKSWTTNNEGIAKTETKLEAGNYKLAEIKIPTGFLQLDKELTFKVDKRNSTLNYDKDYDAWITVTAQNEQPTGTLKLNKKIALREDIDKTMIKDIDFTKISFELVADENIIDYADGSTIYEKGKVVGKYNLKVDGTLTVSNLPMGKYHLKELTTIEGAVLDETEHKIIFEQKDTITKEYIVEKNIENKTTSIEISKTDITGEKELVGAKLTVTDENNEVIDSWVSTEKTHKIEGLKVGKTYTLTEEIAPENYVKATSIKFTVENTADIQKVTMIDKLVIMTKEDIAGKEIEGAELKVVDKDGNVVDSWISTKEAHKIKGLIEGETYTLYEDYAPNGFVISNKIEFTVTEEKETQEIKMIDKVVEISKVNIAGEGLEGATLVVTNAKTKNIVDKWVSTKEPHKVNGLVEGETYILHEEIAIDGYVKATDIEFTVTNEKETQRIEMVDKIVEIVKTDLITGEKLEGAELEIIDKETGKTIEKWISGKEPHIVTGLEENKTYILKEITAPYGYELTEDIEFTVTNEKETQRIEMKDMPILKDIKVVKVDSQTKEIIKEKFTFGIYEDNECTKLIKKIKANKEDGFVTFEDLRYGTFYIKEIKAPNGYELSNRIAKVEINDKGVFVDGIEIKEDNSIYSFEFENKKIETPKTGDTRNILLALMIFVISLIGLVILVVIKLKNK
ncbi:MAG: SpaA isopeptide-forming pilin-related protein [Clostridia bacterium]|nr:SpaA isopeptide-forming pilin-related protein [Clostridia bacterium]